MTTDINEEELRASGFGFTRIVYRKLFWNFLWCKDDSGRTDAEDHPLRDYKPRRLIGNLWWVPNLKSALAEHSKKCTGTFERFEPLP
jgi:hypothetical protein